VAVTDLDQAALERDESRLRSLFGDQSLSAPKNNITNMAQQYPSGFVDDADETNLDDEPLASRFKPHPVNEPAKRVVEDSSEESPERSVLSLFLYDFVFDAPSG
jgi:hypothetical protein